jgi:hypothetical protein
MASLFRKTISLIFSKENRLPLLFTLIGFFLAVVDLADIFFWADEGWSLILAQMILVNGYPYFTDGLYELCPSFGFTSQGLWSVQPWLPFYFTALFIFLLGKSVFMLRLPFVLVGVSCIPLLWHLCRRYSFSKNTQILSCLFLATNVPFLLLIRNVRYYAFLPFFTLVLLIFYQDLLEGKNRRWPLFGLISVLFLHTHEPTAGAVLLGIGIHAFYRVLRQENSKSLLLSLGLSQIMAALFYLPWFFLVWKTRFSFFAKHSDSVVGDGIPLLDAFLGAVLYLIHLIEFHFPLVLLLPFGVLFFLHKNKTPFLNNFMGFFIFLIVLICLVLSVIRNDNLWPGYVISCIPLVLILSASLIEATAKGNKAVLIGLSLAVLLTNSLNLPYWPFHSEKTENPSANRAGRRLKMIQKKIFLQKISFLLPNYMHEIVTPYNGGVEGIVAYLNENAQKGDTFYAANNGHTIHFMTGLSRIMDLPFQKPPTWILRTGGAAWEKGVCASPLKDSNSYIQEYLGQNRYELIVLDAPNLYHENEPIIPFHHFTTPNTQKKVILLRHSANGD